MRALERVGGWGDCAHTLYMYMGGEEKEQTAIHTFIHTCSMNVCGNHIHKHGYIRQYENLNIPMCSPERDSRDYVLSS